MRARSAAKTEGWQRDAVGVGAGLLVLAAVFLATLAFGGDDVPASAAVLAPAVTAMVARAVPTGVVGAMAALVGSLLAWADPVTRGGGAVVRLLLILGATAVFMLLAAQRERREAKLEEGRTLGQLRGLTSQLAGAVTPEDVGAVLSRQGRSVLGAHAAIVYGVTEDHLEMLAAAGYPDGFGREYRRVPMDSRMPVADVIRRRTPLQLSRRALEAEYPELAPAGMLVSKHVLGVPLMLDANPVGAAFFGFQTTSRLSTIGRALAVAMADQSAQALHRARLYESSLQAEAHLRILQEVTAALADAFTVETVSTMVLRQSSQRVDASAAAVALVEPADPRAMRVSAAYGVPDEALARWQYLDIDAPLPAGDCLRANDVIVVENRADMLDRYQALGGEVTAEQGASAIWVPIPGRRGPAGVLAYYFAADRTFDKDARELFRAIASQCGQALERASLLEAEADRNQRVVAEAARAQQLDVLTAAFSHAVTPAEVVNTFVETGVSELGAEHGAMYVAGPGRRSLALLGSQLSAADADQAAKEELLAAEAARDAKAIFLPGDQAIAVVPLTAFRKTLGALNLRFASGHEFSADERAHLVIVGERCGEALERARLYEAERASRLEAQRSAESLAELQSATATLTGCATAADVGEAVLDAALPALDAAAGFVLVQRGDDVELAAARHLQDVPQQWDLEHSPHVAQVLESGRSLIVENLAELVPQLGIARGLFAEAGVAALALVPLRGRDRVVGVLGIGWREPGALSAKTSSVLATFAAVCGQATERAALFDAEHAIADTLQRSLLPVLPVRLGRLELQGRYRAGTLGTQVGGDWFDAIVLPDERVCLVVGDVEGRGVRAASTMGQLRAALRALTRTTADPATLLTALNDGLLASGSPMVTMALAVVGRDGQVAYGYAGHPPIYARAADGSVRELEGGRSVPLGVVDQATFLTAKAELGRGTTVVLYTDGLVERRGVSIDDGLERLIASLHPPAASLLALADRIVGLADGAEQSDDVAVLVAHLATEDDRLVFQPLRHLSDVRGMRSMLAAWLTDQGADDDDVFAMTLAVAEAAVNSLQHAYSIAGGEVDIEVELHDGLARARVRDRGVWRDPEATKDGKRGLRLMHGLAEVDVVKESSGTTVTIARRLGVQP